jgi:hypothetical protein
VLRVFNHDKKVTLVHDVERKRGKVRRRLGRCNLARREQHRGRHDGHCRGIAAPVYGALTRLMRTSRSARKKNPQLYGKRGGRLLVGLANLGSHTHNLVSV